MDYSLTTVLESDFIVQQKLTAQLIPNFDIEFDDNLILNLLQGEVGPVKKGEIVEVPLWLGIYLKEKMNCMIIQPNWMNKEILEQILIQEQLMKEDLTPLKFYYWEESHIYFQKFQEDLQDYQKVRELIEQIEQVRENKINKMIENIKQDDLVLNIPNISFYEINKRRQSLTQFMSTLDELNKETKAQNQLQQTNENLNYNPF